MPCNGSSSSDFFKKLYCVVFFILLKDIITIGYQVDTHQIVKRMELELCLEQFDIHRDTIIRTEESLSIGGKYIQGLNIETLEQCQHLCCETDNCDVFIFEGKNGGYCYLFECGPPENFRCKFTRHANYTSAVLTPVRRITTPSTTKPPPPVSNVVPPAVQPQPSLSQHELELTNLKQKLDANDSQVPKVVPTISPHGVHPVQISTTAKTTTSVCRRFQFQCHSGECIAVYNACDGIPQCEDGSDEGPECPANTVSNGKLLTGGKPEEVPSLSADKSSRVQTTNDLSAGAKVELQSAPRLYPQSANINNREDPMSAPPVWPHPKLQEPQEIDRNSRIFNHKGGLQIPTNNVAQPFSNPIPNLYNSIQRDMYMQPDYISYRNSIIQPQDHMMQPQNINWQQPQLAQPLIPVGPYIAAVNGQSVPEVKPSQLQQTPPLNTTAPIVQQPVPQQNQLTQTNSAGASSGNKKENDRPDDTKTENDNGKESEEYDEYEERSTEAPKKKQHKHRKLSEKGNKSNPRKNKAKTEKPVDAPLHEQLKMIRDDMEMEFIDHDGKSERPGGAVLSLTLGIIVTAALAVLVGCRMRTVSRRSRRSGKAPYAHDADFLVNGMYL